MRLGAFLRRSRVNGPGTRFVIWFQGCSLGCPSCCNPAMQFASGGREVPVGELLAGLRADLDGLEGVTLSGGEPLQQMPAALELARGVRNMAGLSLVVFSGFELEEIRALPGGGELLAATDLLVAGRYVRERHLGRGLLGSANQRLHFLSDRYSPADVEDLPELEVHLHPGGRVEFTGITSAPQFQQ